MPEVLNNREEHIAIGDVIRFSSISPARVIEFSREFIR